MISKIYTVNQTSAAIAEPASGAYALIPFGSVVRRKGRGVTLEGGALVGHGSGYFEIDGDLEFIPAATGTVAVQLYQDGTAVAGSQKTVSGTASTPVHIPLLGMARLIGGCCSATSQTTSFTVGVNAAGTVSSMTAVTTKLD